MSIRIGLSLAVALGAAVGFANVASAEMATAPKAAKPKTVTVTGCATKGTPEFCTMIKGPKGANYNISGANPSAPIDKKIRLRGAVTDKMSPCGGTVLDDIKWMPIRGGCPKAK
jgi:hypothetical protein